MTTLHMALSSALLAFAIVLVLLVIALAVLNETVDGLGVRWRTWRASRRAMWRNYEHVQQRLLLQSVRDASAEVDRTQADIERSIQDVRAQVERVPPPRPPLRRDPTVLMGDLPYIQLHSQAPDAWPNDRGEWHITRGGRGMNETVEVARNLEGEPLRRRQTAIERDAFGQIVRSVRTTYRNREGQWVLDTMEETAHIREPIPPSVREPDAADAPVKEKKPTRIKEPELPPTLERRIRLS